MAQLLLGRVSHESREIHGPSPSATHDTPILETVASTGLPKSASKHASALFKRCCADFKLATLLRQGVRAVRQDLASSFELAVSLGRLDLGRLKPRQQLLELSSATGLAIESDLEFTALTNKGILFDRDLANLGVDLVESFGGRREVGVVRIERGRGSLVGVEQREADLAGRFDIGVKDRLACTRDQLELADTGTGTSRTRRIESPCRRVRASV